MVYACRQAPSEHLLGPGELRQGVETALIDIYIITYFQWFYQSSLSEIMLRDFTSQLIWPMNKNIVSDCIIFILLFSTKYLLTARCRRKCGSENGIRFRSCRSSCLSGVGVWRDWSCLFCETEIWRQWVEFIWKFTKFMLFIFINNFQKTSPGNILRLFAEIFNCGTT